MTASRFALVMDSYLGLPPCERVRPVPRSLYDEMTDIQGGLRFGCYSAGLTTTMTAEAMRELTAVFAETSAAAPWREDWPADDDGVVLAAGAARAMLNAGVLHADEVRASLDLPPVALGSTLRVAPGSFSVTVS